MSRTRVPTAEALHALRRGLADGAHPPGRAIVVVDEARRLRLSTTPIREALSRLAGEGLVEPGPAGGFVAARLDAADIRDGFQLHAVYLEAALDLVSASRAAAAGGSGTAPGDAALESVFVRIGLRSGNRALAAARERLGRRLTLVRRAEAGVLLGLEPEAREIRRLEANGCWPALKQALSDYHARRQAAAGALLVAMQALARPAPPMDAA